MASRRGSASGVTSASCALTSSAGCLGGAAMPRAARQLAGVAVDDDTWRRFRQAGLLRDLSVSAYLGQLVERERRRRASRAVGEAATQQPSRDQALRALNDVCQAIDELDQIAGRLARTAGAPG